MSTEANLNCVTFEAGQDLSARQYCFVSVASDEQIDPTSSGARAIGVLQDDPSAAGRAAQVAIGGRTKIKLGGTVTAGGEAMSGANGVGVAATTGNQILGIFTVAGDSGDIGEMIFAPQGAKP